MIIASFQILIRHLLPFHKRTINRLKWLRVFAKVADAVMTWCKAYMAEANNRANLTANTKCLEWHLNNLFDPTQRRIFIKHNEGSGVEIGLIEEGDTYALLNALNAGEDANGYNEIPLIGEDDNPSDAEFFVYCDIATMPVDKITAEVERFRIAGTSFSVLDFN